MSVTPDTTGANGGNGQTPDRNLADRARKKSIGQHIGETDTDTASMSEAKAAISASPDSPFLARPPRALLGCPVRPLGTYKGVYFYLTPMKQFRAMQAGRMSNAGEIASLFEHEIGWLEEIFPRFTKDGERAAGWVLTKARDFLLCRAAEEGLFDPETRISEAGVWRMPNDSLLVHLGDRLLVYPGDREVSMPVCLDPGIYDGQVFPAGRTLAEPDLLNPAPASFGEGLRKSLGMWNFARPELDTLLLTGLIGMLHYGGALRWRAHGWVMGDTGTGKTTLRHVVGACLGDLLRSSTDATPAGVRNWIKNQSTSVSLDELENDPDQRRRNNELIKVMRLGSTRGQGSVLRSDPGQNVIESHIDAAFIAWSVNVPGLLPQDRNRMTIFSLGELRARHDHADQAAMANELVDVCRRICPRLRARMFIRWTGFLEAERRARAALLKRGHNSRFCDQYAAQLAGAAVMTSDHLSEVDFEAWAALVTEGTTIEKDDQGLGDAQRCLARLLSSKVENLTKGELPQIGELVANCIHSTSDPERHADNRLLRRNGLALVRHAVRDGSGHESAFLWLAVANIHPALDRIFIDTPWQPRPGVTGPWRASLERFPNTIVPKDPISFGGDKSRALLIWIENVKPQLGDLAAE